MIEKRKSKNKSKTLMSWSSGKDSAWALYELQMNPEIDLVGLFCTVNKEFGRVSMHGVRVELLHKQAQSIGLPLEIIEIPYPCSNEEYAKLMQQFVEQSKINKIENFAFGDLFLEDVRQYREERLSSSGIEPIFPIWGIPTDKLAREMIGSSMKMIITCIDPKQISEKYIGKPFDEKFLNSLPETADPCGENGEFHSFVYAGPMFKQKIEVSVGETVYRDNYIFADVFSNKS